MLLLCSIGLGLYDPASIQAEPALSACGSRGYSRKILTTASYYTPVCAFCPDFFNGSKFQDLNNSKADGLHVLFHTIAISLKH
jgi:hypothetical protein